MKRQYASNGIILIFNYRKLMSEIFIVITVIY